LFAITNYHGVIIVKLTMRETVIII
jgi:hypothetical protein